METNDLVIKWKWLKSQLSLVRDEDLRKVMMAELRKRAYEEWGFDPETTKINSVRKIELDDWEKEFVEDIKKAEIYELDTRVGKREKTRKEAKARMKDFISKGGCLKDIPEDVRSNTIEKLFYECLFEYGDKIMEEADRFIKK